MFNDWWPALGNALGIGLDPLELTGAQVAFRATVIYIFGLLLVRFADKRLLGKNTAFDVVLGIILGSVLSRAINGSAPFFPTMAGGVVLVALHWLLAFLSSRYRSLGALLKGNPVTLVRDGEVLWREMRRNHLSEGDLIEMLRLRGRLAGPDEVGEARLERNGEISAIPRRREPRVVELPVKDGVQAIRVELA